jgi:hypothetical protein
MPSPAASPVSSAGAWFDAGVRPLVAYSPDAEGAAWRPAEAAPTAAEMDAIADAARADGATPRIALTWAAGWQAGAMAMALAAGVLRDGLLLRGGLEVLVHRGGWVADVRVDDARAAVGPASPAAFADAVAALCRPTVEALAGRSGRGRAGLWAQVADGVGWAAAAMAGAEPSRPHDEVIAAAQALLEAPGAPWRTAPGLRTASTVQGPVLVVHRGSCCLAYRCETTPPPEYCDTCLFREAADVTARVVAASASGPA